MIVGVFCELVEGVAGETDQLKRDFEKADCVLVQVSFVEFTSNGTGFEDFTRNGQQYIYTKDEKGQGEEF